MDIPPDLVITITDARRAGYCVTGIRDWFKRHDLSLASFVRDGLPASEALKIGDAFVTKVIASKLEREG